MDDHPPVGRASYACHSGSLLTRNSSADLFAGTANTHPTNELPSCLVRQPDWYVTLTFDSRYTPGVDDRTVAMIQAARALSWLT